MKNTTVEIASYPKSGNTWFRHLVANFIKDVGHECNVGLIPDLHQSWESVKDRTFFSVGDSLVSFYKSHRPDHPRVWPDVVIYLYRHPLDVFTSVLNHFYINNKNDFFKNGERKAPGNILRDDEIGFYFERFNKDLGSGFFPEMLQEMSNYETHAEFMFESKKCVPVKYEDLFLHRESCFAGVMKTVLGEKNGSLGNANFDAVDDRTKRSGNPFYWKSRCDIYKDYLSEEMVTAFYNEHTELMSRLGYN